jgi:hypothetical protein
MFTSVSALKRQFEPKAQAQKAAAEQAEPQSRESWYRKLMDSEDKYCNYLTRLARDLVKPFKDDSKTAKPVLFPRQDYQRIVVFLTNIETLVTLNAGFRDDLKAKKAAGLGQVWTQYARYALVCARALRLTAASLFRMYGQYATECAPAIEIVAAQAKANDKLAEFLQRFDERNGPYIKLLRMPLDRINHYTLMMHSLVTASAAEPDLDALVLALEELESVASHVQEQLDGSKKLNRLRELQQTWMGSALLARSRSFFHDGVLDKVSRKHTQTCHFLLLGEMLMYGVPVANDKVRHKRCVHAVSVFGIWGG